MNDFLRRWRLDAAFGAIALLFGLPSLAYPYGRDQGLFFYAAREWLKRGQVLYRDVWDHKPPVIYFLHMFAIGVFGEHLWSIRILELFIAVPALGYVAARLATPIGESIPRGTIGAGWLVSSVFYWGYFDYWDTAQCEVWCALFSLASIACIVRGKGWVRAYGLGGFFSAIALFTKPPTMPYVALAVLLLAVRAYREGGRREIVRAIVAYAAGGLVFAGPLLAYFAATHALEPMIDIVVRANRTYVSQERGATDTVDVFVRSIDGFRLFQPFTGITLVCGFFALAWFAVKRDRSLFRYALPIALLCAAWGQVVMQLKFYHYHWGTLVGGMGVFGAMLWNDLSRFAESRARFVGAAFVFCVALVYTLSADSAERFFITARNVVRYERGSLNREEYARTFDKGYQFYSCRDAEVIGAWLREQSKPEDTLAVRGFEPEIYAISGMRYTGRFYWTTFLTAQGRQYRREELLKEDRDELERHPPRYVVALLNVSPGIDTPDYFEARGYTVKFRTPSLVVLERTP